MKNNLLTTYEPYVPDYSEALVKLDRAVMLAKDALRSKKWHVAELAFAQVREFAGIAEQWAIVKQRTAGESGEP